MVLTSIPACRKHTEVDYFLFGGETMTVPTAPAKKTPWLLIVLGVLVVLCLCAIVIGIAIFAFLIPIRGNIVTEEPPVVATVQIDPIPTTVTSEETEESVDTPNIDAAPAGTTVDIGSGMTLTVLD